jgi:hypothetical protein
VAIAAVAALFLFATTTAFAVPVTWVVDSTLSTISTGQAVDISTLFALPHGSVVNTFIPQYPDPDGPGPITGSDITYVSGTITGDVVPGVSINLGAAAMPLLVNNTPGAGGFAGAFAPGDPPSPYPGGVYFGAQFGLKSGPAGGILLNSMVHDLALTWAEVVEAGPRPLGVGGVFPYIPGNDGLFGIAGTVVARESTGALDLGPDSLVGSVISALGTADSGAHAPTWDPTDLTAGPNGTLTLPVYSLFSSTFDLAAVDDGILYISSFGTIVATPTAPVVPEPSSMVLLAFGLIGLVTCGWRWRKRRV